MYLLHQAFTVPLNRFSPDESILIGFGLNLCPVNVFHIQPDEAFGREKEYGLGKYLVDFLFHPVAETVDGNEIRFLISGKPDIMDVTMKELFNFTAGVDVVHIGIENDLEHHPGMVRAAAAFLIQLPETFKVQALNQSVNHPNWIMLCNILVNSLRKKHCLVGIIRTKMYLCHSENLMPKDTKSLGNNKAPACESRGFVLKKKKVRILTHLLKFLSPILYLQRSHFLQCTYL